ncbi:SDR family oxidoreductase [Marinoscillum pacificum]|uniref:SDR family oxidoreductase n=1 Tax=Marinoscillum pacificum TaxID=392723 RepID=UPI0021588AB5|nr:SDR family oxidoreductase [Marinoscillum pacificum]
MKVLIIGANGQIGQILAHKLKKSNLHPVAMVRKAEQVDQFKSKDIETVVADLEEDFEYAYDGINAVVFAAGSGGHTGPDKTHLVDRLGAKKAIDLAVKKKVKHFTIVSALGADYNPSEWPDSMKHYYEAKADADKHLMQSGLNFTIVKPGRLTNDPGTNNITLGAEITKESDSIPRTDVATVLEKVIANQKAMNHSLELLSGSTPIDKAVEAL